METIAEKALVFWIGHTDLRAMGNDLGGSAKERVVAVTGGWGISPDKIGAGPVRSLLDRVSFARVDALSTFPEDITRMYCDWLGNKCVHSKHIQLRDPSNYGEVFRAADKAFEDCWQRCRQQGWQLCVHLTPGTPTMTTVSVFLGKTKFPAILYQTYQGSVSEVELPFEIDRFVMDSFRKPDSLLANVALKSPGEPDGFENIIGKSEALREAVDRARRVALRDINVLLTGETGTGKEMFARAIHRVSKRRDKPFLALNCAAMPGPLFEAEVFGYMKGAFTGAEEEYAGAFEQADGGVLFLDEVGELSKENQSKLLRALQPLTNDPPCTCRIRRLRATKEVKVSVRVIGATNRNLLKPQSDWSFRDDLYYRLATVSIELPSLKKRQSDIRLLVQDILGKLNQLFAVDEPGYVPKTITREAQEVLDQHDWPGNVRELNNVLVQAAVMCEGNLIGRRDIQQSLAPLPESDNDNIISVDRPKGFRLEQRLDDIKRLFVERAFQDSGGKNNAAAASLGISPSAMSKYRRKYAR